VTEPENLLARFADYRAARLAFLETLGLGHSNRDPLAEFAEHLVCSVLGGTLAGCRTQKGWDVETADHVRVQVKYVADPERGTVGNWHNIIIADEADEFALVVLERLVPKAIHVFTRESLDGCYDALDKTHANRGTRLNFTGAVHDRIIADPATFERLGVRTFAFGGHGLLTDGDTPTAMGTGR
jgi:hypothetical protein